MKRLCLIFFVFSFYSGLTQITSSDSLVRITDSITPKQKAITNASPRKASILSAIIPGAGQVYNRKYWKVPIVYAGLGGFGYFFLKNQNEYTYYRKNLIALVAGDSSVISTTGYNTSQLQTQKLLYRKRRDLFGFALLAVYAVNIIDANVDAHLKTFDVSDDLSLDVRAKPVLIGSMAGISYGGGISLTLNFK